MDRVEYQSLVIQDILNFHDSGELNISPWYQRRSVWTSPQKSYLINTLFEQKPIPALYIRHSIDLESEKSVKEVVDGQQRTRTILEFLKNEFSARHPKYEKRIKFNELKPADRQKFLLTSLPVGYLLGADDADVIDIFGRINSVSKTLNAQEKRNASYSGEFKQFCLAQSSSRVNFWRNYGIFTANDIARMNEVQFVSDLALNFMKGLSDFSPTRLNNIYAEFDEEFPVRDEIIARFDNCFDLIGSLKETLIKDTIFKRQPLFFSLAVAIDRLQPNKSVAVERAIIEADNRFNAEENQSESDLDFIRASTSSTQRIAQRRVRDEYLGNLIAG